MAKRREGFFEDADQWAEMLEKHHEQNRPRVPQRPSTATLGEGDIEELGDVPAGPLKQPDIDVSLRDPAEEGRRQGSVATAPHSVDRTEVDETSFVYRAPVVDKIMEVAIKAKNTSKGPAMWEQDKVPTPKGDVEVVRLHVPTDISVKVHTKHQDESVTTERKNGHDMLEALAANINDSGVLKTVKLRVGGEKVNVVDEQGYSSIVIRGASTKLSEAQEAMDELKTQLKAERIGKAVGSETHQPRHWIKEAHLTGKKTSPDVPEH